MNQKVEINNEIYEVKVLKHDDKNLSFLYEGEVYHYKFSAKEGGEIFFEKNNEFLKAFVENQFDTKIKQVFYNDREAYTRAIPLAKKSEGQTAGVGSLVSPMPGKIFKIMKNVGDSVTIGEPILIMEAMKMEHTISSHKDGVIKDIFFKVGDQVKGKSLLCEIE